MVTDRVGDFIIQLKNAGMAGRSSVSVPYTKLTHAIAEKLAQQGFLASVSVVKKKNGEVLAVELTTDTDGRPRILDVKRVSSPGRRLYRKSTELHPVRTGTGALILSTPKGILTAEEAKQEHVGGEALFEIW